jgi:hypothetical protein
VRISIINQPQIEALSAALKQCLVTLAAAIQTGWGQQHDGDGGHTDVTATSAAVTGSTTVGKLILNTITLPQRTLVGTENDFDGPGLIGASHVRIVRHSNPLLLNGINATGRVPGDLLLLTNGDDSVSVSADIQIQFENAGSLPANRFCANPASPGGGANFVLNGGRSVWLVYSFTQTGTGVPPNFNSVPIPRWYVVDQA